MDYPEFKRSIDLYLDGELDSESTLKFQEMMESEPKYRDLVEREERLRLRVREELSQDRAPDLLRAKILRGIRREDRSHRMTYITGWRVAAAVLLAVLLGGGVYFQYDRQDLSHLVQNSVQSHELYTSSGSPVEFAANTENALLPKLKERMQFAMALPSLSQNNFKMKGGRICLLVNRKSALVFYQRGDERLSLFMISKKDIRLPAWGGREIQGRSVYFQESEGYRVAVWKDRDCIYSLVAQADENQLAKYLTAGLREVVGSDGY
jgi:anti-sigma factor RsiW